MAVNEGPMPIAISSGLEKLWRSWDYGVSRMGKLFRSLLGRYGEDVFARIGFGPDRQQRRILQSELSMDRQTNQFNEPKGIHRYRRFEFEQGDRYFTHDVIQPDTSGLAKGKVRDQTIVPKRVFDIINCGPRQRFVVRGDGGPFIVHNCVQGLARCVVAEQMLLISKRYRPVLTVHDAAVIVAPQEEQDEAVAFIEKCMSFVPEWAQGLPVACESGVDYSYGGT
jgi:hypothetical protein